jgi:hypothetical protein
MGKRIADRAIPTIQVISQGVIIIATGMILTVIGAGIYESLRTLHWIAYRGHKLLPTSVDLHFWPNDGSNWRTAGGRQK